MPERRHVDRVAIPVGPVQVAVAAYPWGTSLGDDPIEAGIDVGVSSWRRYRADQLPATAKGTGPYVNSVLASLEAQRDGYDQAILLNADCRVAEGPGENVFVVDDGAHRTPGLSEDVLGGITCDSVARLARDLGYAVDCDATIGRGELYAANELFFVGTAAELIPIRSVDGTRVGEGTRGPVTAELQERFFAVVERRTGDSADWFTPIGAGATAEAGPDTVVEE